MPTIRPTINYALAELSGPVNSRTTAQTAVSSVQPTFSVTERSDSQALLVHSEFLDWLTAVDSDQHLVKRARFILTELFRQGFARGTKGVRGPARGWLRAPLGGGSNGFHFYLWHATGGSAFGRGAGLTTNQLLVRSVRHHNRREMLDPGNANEWIEIHPSDVVASGEDTPFTIDQVRVATPSPITVRTVRGLPGSGKTTALLLSALTSGNDRVLYLTFNHRLVNEARLFLDTFLPDPGRADVLSYESFLEEVADAHPGSIQIAKSYECAQVLAETLKPHVAKGLGAWEGLVNELYDELHAHAFGRAVPFAFRGAPASPNAFIAADEYEKMRRTEGLGESARDAAEFLNQVAAGQPERLFPGPFCARSLLDDIDAPPPPRFSNVGLILVDEVQDLTPVEVLLVLNLAARVGIESGRFPQLIVAGDESQTVRPTEFEWSWLHELVRTVLPDASFKEFVLDVNLRSPQLLAEFVEATKSQYRSLAKADRPAGQTQTLVDDSVLGRVIYTTNPSDTYIEELIDLVSQTPRCALVYPGTALPDEIWARDAEEVALSAAEAKGLDFETVVVVDAGTRQAELQRLLGTIETEPQGVVRARSLADQFRVATSRSTYNLVLVDRNDQVHHLESMIGRPWTEDLEKVDFSDLHEELVGDADDEQLLRALIRDIDTLLLDNVHKALQRSRSASRRLERMRRLQEVPSGLETEVNRVRGISAALTLAGPHSDLDPSERAALIIEANDHLAPAGLAEPLDAYMKLVGLKTEYPSLEAWDPTTLAAIDRAVTSRSELSVTVPSVLDRLDRFIVRWIQQACKAGAAHIAQFDDLLQAMRRAADHVAAPHQYVRETIDTACSDWALICIDSGRPALGLDLLSYRNTTDHKVRGRCLESLQRWVEATDDYVEAGLTADAVHCARRSGDYLRAAQIHGASDDITGRSISLMKTLTTTFEDAGEVALIPEEIEGLIAAIQQRQISKSDVSDR